MVSDLDSKLASELKNQEMHERSLSQRLRDHRKLSTSFDGGGIRAGGVHRQNRRRCEAERRWPDSRLHG